MNTCIMEVRRPDGCLIFVNETETGCEVVEQHEKRTLVLTIFGSKVVLELLESSITSHADSGRALADAFRKACA